MNLLLDVGNSRIKWALADHQRLHASGSIAHDGSSFPEHDLAAECRFDQITAVYLASVAPAAILQSVSKFLQRHCDVAITRVSVARNAHGVTCGYDDPTHLGVDRWVALIAARHMVVGPVCVVDAGTAVTIDGMDADGRHLGGVIFAGSRMMRHALSTGTGALPLVEQEQFKVFATDTRPAIYAGTELATAGGIELICARIERMLGGHTTCLLTGGGAATVTQILTREFRHETALVLEGLRVIASHTPTT